MIENEFTEFKREYISDIKREVVAFANTKGGKIYVGINDNGSVCGVENIDDTMLKLTSLIHDAIRPDVMMFINCALEYIEDKPVVVVTVQRGTECPYYLANKGLRSEGVFIRQGSATVPASETAILNMIKETSGDCYEEARSLCQTLTFEQTAAYFKKYGVTFGIQQQRTLHIIGEDGTYTNLGMLLSDQCIHTVKLALFDGVRKTVFRDRKELRGSLITQLEDAYDWINRYNKLHAKVNDLHRVDRRDYPPEAVREALLNAIVHRDYSISASILISMFDDRIELVSVGGLLQGVSFQDIMLGVSALRNKNLANVFYRLKLIEAYGTGIMKINDCYYECDIKPKFEVSDHAFKITLPNVNVHEDKSLDGSSNSAVMFSKIESKDERKKVVLQMVKQHGQVARRDIEGMLNVSQSTAVNLLREMVKGNLLVKVGKGKNVEYRIGTELK